MFSFLCIISNSLQWNMIKMKGHRVWRQVQSIGKKKNILDLIKILNIPLIAQVLLKVLMDLKSLVSINLNNPVLQKTSGHAPQTYFPCSDHTLYGKN